MNWWERLTNMYMYLTSIFVYLYASDRTTAVFRQHFGNDHFPHLRELAANSAIAFVNSDEFVDFARPTLHKTIYIGGVGLAQPQPLEPVCNLFVYHSLIIMPLEIRTTHEQRRQWYNNCIVRFIRAFVADANQNCSRFYGCFSRIS